MDVLCSDKTGTLTKNQLTCGEPQPGRLASARDDLLPGGGAGVAARDAPDAIDAAILAGAPAGPQPRRLHRLKAFHPFDPVAKRADGRGRAPVASSFSVGQGRAASDRQPV